MSTLEIKLNVPDDLLICLREEAERRNVSLDVVVSESLTAYFEDLSEPEILDSIKQWMKDALSGNYRPARDVLDGLN